MATLVQGPLHRARPAPHLRRAVGALFGTAALILMTGMVATPAGASTPTISGKITGTGGVGLAGASVTFDSSPAPGIGLSTTITTAADGTFSTAPGPGSYQLSVSAGGYLSGWYSNASPNGYTANEANATTVVLGTTAISGIDVRLPQAGTISGTITGPGGKALAGIAVSASSTSSGVGNGALTDANGGYAIDGLPLGLSYTLYAQDTSRTYVSGSFQRGVPGNFTFDGLSATSISLSTASPEASAINVQLPAGHLVSGTVKTAAGSPVANAFVVPTLPDNFGTSCPLTSSSGAYACRVPSGSYKMQFSGQLGSSLPTCYYRTGNICTTDASQATTVTVADADVSGIDIVLPAAASPSPTPTAKPTTKPTARPTTKPRGTLPPTSLGTRSGPADTPPTLPLAIVFLLGAALTLTILSYRHRPLR